MSLYKEITENEMKLVLHILKNPLVMYNANNISKEVGLSSMGALKILKRLEKESLLISKEIGKSVVYRINVENDYSKNCIKFFLSRETNRALGELKKWINELNKIKNSELTIIFGSILKNKESKDIDVLFVTDQKKFDKLKKEVDSLNEISIKKIHPVYQSFNDVVNNIKEKNEVMLDAIRGIVVFGEEKFLEVYNESRKE